MGGICWLASYPKSGNTWLRAFLRNLRDDGDAPADINRLGVDPVAGARSWLDEVLGFDTADLTEDEVELVRPAVYDWSAQAEEVTCHKIHDAYTSTASGEPLVGREGTLGAVYVIRNPLDVAPSAADHWNCTVDKAIEWMGAPAATLSGGRRTNQAQVRQRLLTWSEHVLSWVDAPGLRCEVIRYEDMESDPQAVFARAAAFLDLPHDPIRVAKAVRFSRFEELARQEERNGFRERPQHACRFFRRGGSGGWREALTDEQVRRIVTDHGEVMRRFGYLDASGDPV
jgi:aryl sulfotransferase